MQYKDVPTIIKMRLNPELSKDIKEIHISQDKNGDATLYKTIGNSEKARTFCKQLGIKCE